MIGFSHILTFYPARCGFKCNTTLPQNKKHNRIKGFCNY